MVTAGSAMLQQGMLCKMVCCIKWQLLAHVPACSMADGPTQAGNVHSVLFAQHGQLAQLEHIMLPLPEHYTAAAWVSLAPSAPDYISCYELRPISQEQHQA